MIIIVIIRDYRWLFYIFIHRKYYYYYYTHDRVDIAERPLKCYTSRLNPTLVER
jgi:hypothetical protein